MKGHYSVFDEYYASQDVNIAFSWEKFDPSQYSAELEPIFEGPLREYNPSNCTLASEHHYLVTRDTFFKFLVPLFSVVD